MKICGIVGWKNSGKTFFAQELISFFTYQKLNVASIKHAHHDFDIDKPETDSFLHRQAGSRQVIISSSKRWAKISELNKANEKTLYELIDELKNPDIIIVEGYKNEKHAKIEIIKNDLDPSIHLFPHLKNVIGIVADFKIETSIKQFKKNEIALIAGYILQRT
ncbi:MAG: molybdopterin-guanine dinucleotide biosynthesis protein B [SAR202 cluster bacterium]|nr:molybdopterin-guanine dinucleotide biosynthesis protein B [SAR202 cluster bacterium]